MGIPSINLSWITPLSIGLIIWLPKWFLDLTRDLAMPCIGLESRTMGSSRASLLLRCRRLCQCFFTWRETRMPKLLSKKSEWVSTDILQKSQFQGIFLRIWNKESRLPCLVLKLLAKVLLLVSLYPDRKMMAGGWHAFMFTNIMRKFWMEKLPLFIITFSASIQMEK